MSKVLTFIDWYTPAYKAGGPIRSMRNLVEATGNVHDYYIVTGSNDFTETEVLENITTGIWTDVGKAKVIYLLPEDRNEKRYAELFEEIQPDFIYLNSLFSPQFTLKALKVFKSEKKKIVLAPRGMLGKESLKIKSTKKKIFLMASKTINLYKGITWHATNDIERDLIVGKFGNKSNVKIAPNLPFVSSEDPLWIEKKPGELKLVSVSRIVPIKNILLLLDSLKNAKSEVVLTIVGPNEDESYWSRCLEVISSLGSNVQVNYIGQVNPNHIGKYYQKSHVYVSPTLNENYGHSIVEAWGFGRPVIISDKTPWKNLEKKGVGFDLELKKEFFTDRIEFFAGLDQKEFDSYQKRVREFALNELINESLLERCINLFKD